jgi:hypothetical protein
VRGQEKQDRALRIDNPVDAPFLETFKRLGADAVAVLAELVLDIAAFDLVSAAVPTQQPRRNEACDRKCSYNAGDQRGVSSSC